MSKSFLFIAALLLPVLAAAQKPAEIDSAKQNAQKSQPKEEEPGKDVFIDVAEEPHPLHELKVEYPKDAVRSALEGKVTVQELIGKDGEVKKIEIVSADYDIFRKPAIDAMMHQKFTPAKGLDGKPAAVWYTQSINFKLSAGEDSEEKK